MWNLVYKDMVQMRGYIIQVFGSLLALALVFGRVVPEMMGTFFFVYPLVAAMTVPQVSFGNEERGSTLVFLRALPIRPREIVASKYMVLAAIVGLLLLLHGIQAIVAGGAGSLAAISAVVLAACLLAATSNFLHFWLGVRSARVASLVVVLAVWPAVMLLWVDPQRAGALERTVNAVVALAGSAHGIVLSLLAGVALLYLSYACSCAVFCRRDIGRLP